MCIYSSLLLCFYCCHLSCWTWSEIRECWLFHVLGNAKGAVAVVVSILIFRNPVSITGMLGYSLTLIGVVLYSEAKKRSKWNSLRRYMHDFSLLLVLFCLSGLISRKVLGSKAEQLLPGDVIYMHPVSYFFSETGKTVCACNRNGQHSQKLSNLN